MEEPEIRANYFRNTAVSDLTKRFIKTEEQVKWTITKGQGI